MKILIATILFMLVCLPAEGNREEIRDGVSTNVMGADSVAGCKAHDITFIVAFGTIQAAVNAITDGPNSRIFLPKKIYHENVDIDKSLQLIGKGARKTIVDGDTDKNGIGNGRVFTIYPGHTVTLKDMTVENGDADNDDYVYSGQELYSVGGGILNEGSTLTVENCNINNNFAGIGGGIYNDPNGVLTIKSSRIFSNIASGYGGGVSNDFGVATIKNSQIYSNAVWSYDGGGIDNSGGNLIVDRCDIYRNIAYGYGGGIDNWGGALAVTNSRIFENTAEGAGGISNSARMTLVASKVFKNTANYEGGGIVNYDDGVNLIQADLIGSAIYDNIAGSYGGGISNNGVSGTAVVNLDNSQIFGNKVEYGMGGGIYNLGTTLNLNSGSIKKNTASYGGGIYNEADGVVNLNSGSISKNTATAATPSGGGIFNNLGTIGGTGDPTVIVQGNTPDQIKP